MTKHQQPVLEVRGLTTIAENRHGRAVLVGDVSFAVHRGETLGLVGESGSGKSMTALSILRLNPSPGTRIVSGEIRLDGVELLSLAPKVFRTYRGRHIAMILQDPQTALNPVLTIGEQIFEPLRLHRGLRGAAMREQAVSLLRMLRVPDPERRLGTYPHQLSGGMRQRVVGAIALSCNPSVLIADEPTTSLDVTIQAAYLDLLKDIQRETHVAILFITHDFGVIRRMCDRVAVMYAGTLVESGPTEMVLRRPYHSYTEALVRAVPDVRSGTDRLYSIPGQPPDPFNRASGCPFAARCPDTQDRCRREMPPWVELSQEHGAACWRNLP